MAKLLNSEYKLPDLGNGWEAHLKAFEAIPADRLYSHPCADSSAYYYIKSDNPLVLQHIPFCDAWTLPSAHIRGLRLSDIEDQRAWKRSLAELFKK